MLSSIAVPVWADDNDIYYHGNANKLGNSEPKNTAESIKASGSDNIVYIGNIDIQMSGIDPDKGENQDTSAALVLKDKRNYEVLGDVIIKNTIDTPSNPDLGMANNDGLQVIYGTKVKIENKNVYIASLGGSGFKNLCYKKSTALSVGIGDGNTIDISGSNVKIIGNIDFTTGDSTQWNQRRNNNVFLTLNSENSYFYGDVYDEVRSILGFIGGKQGTAYVTLNNGAEWIYDETSKIENLELNGGIVVLDDAYIQNKYENEIVKVYDSTGQKLVDEVKLSDDRTANHKKVTIENLSGNGGIFKVDLDWSTNKGTDGLGQKKETENSDYIYIEKMDAKANGNSTQIIDFDASKAHLDQMKIGKDRLYFANVADSGTDFVTVNGTKQAVSSGAGNILATNTVLAVKKTK